MSGDKVGQDEDLDENLDANSHQEKSNKLAKEYKAAASITERLEENSSESKIDVNSLESKMNLNNTESKTNLNSVVSKIILNRRREDQNNIKSL